MPGEQQQFDLSTAASDPDFLHAGMGDKVAFLSAHDADFAKADPKDQAGYINHILGNDKKAPEPSTYEKLTSPFGPDSDTHNPITRTASAAGAALMQTPEMIGTFLHHPVDTLKGIGNQAVESAKTWAEPKTRPSWDQIKSVLPEAIGGGIGSVAGGELTGAAIPKVAGAARAGVGAVAPEVIPAVSRARTALRNRVFEELPTKGPTLTPEATKTASLAGGAIGEIAGTPGGVAGYMAGPTILKKLVGKPELGDIRNPGPFSEVPKEMPKIQSSTISEGPTAVEHAEARQQIKDMKKPVPISEGPTAAHHAAVRAGQAQVNKLAERKVVPLSESPTPEPAEAAAGEGEIPIVGGGKNGKGGANAPESKTSGSEGTAARWTNDYVMEQARKGDRTAIEQSARRGLQLPPNARYVMGDVDIPRVVLNPKEVTRFTPEGTPIRDMSRPETSSRERIQPAGGETIPPVEPLFQTPSMKVPSDTVRAGIHMDPINPPAARVEGVLPGMEGDVVRQAEGAAKVKGEDLTRQANTPKNVEEAAGQLETKSPLFRGTAASPQKEIFAPGGEPSATHAGEPPTAEELSPEHVDLPKLKEAFTAAEADRQYVADEFHQGRATYKELQDAQKAAEKAKDAVDEAEGTNEQMRQLHERLAKEAERNNPERIDAARDLVFDTIHKLKNMERGGPSWSDYTADTRPTAAGRGKGDFYGGKAGSIPSGRATIPWLQNRPKWGWSKLEAAMMSGKSKLYNEVVRAADEYLQGQTPEGKAANAATAERVVESTPTSGPAKFANFQKPTKLEPPAAEPPAPPPPAEAAPSAGLPKTAHFSKSQWDRFTPDRKNAEYALAKRRGQTIDIYTKK